MAPRRQTRKGTPKPSAASKASPKVTRQDSGKELDGCVVVEDPPWKKQAAADEGLGHVLERISTVTGGEIQEPGYLDIDQYMINKLLRLQHAIRDFATKHFSFHIKKQASSETKRTLIRNGNFQLARIVSDVADGGPDGEEGWVELVSDVDHRVALVRAVVGRVVQEYVLKSLLFGATMGQRARLRIDDVKGIDSDGFNRAMQRKTMVEGFLNGHTLPQNFKSDVEEATVKIYRMLWPILVLDANYKGSIRPRSDDAWEDFKADNAEDTVASFREKNQIKDLYNIVAQAAFFNLRMRLDDETVYIFRDAFKDEAFDSKSMAVTNVKYLAAEHPAKKYTRLGDGKRPDLEAMQRLVRIVVFPECVAYRRGGFRGEDYDQGWRERRLTKALCHLRWGTPQYYRDGTRDENFKPLAPPGVLTGEQCKAM